MRKPDSNSQFLRTGLQLLRAEFPERFAAVSALLAKIPGVYEVGRERFKVTAAEGRISVRKERNVKNPRVQANLDPKGILAMVDGTCTVQRLLAREQLILIADADALLTLSEVVRLVLESAIRSSTLQNHFEGYRKWVLGRDQ